MSRQLYKVTIHEHKIYDSFVDASSVEEAREIAENQIIEEENHTWREDHNAGWTELGDIYDEDENLVR